MTVGRASSAALAQAAHALRIRAGTPQDGRHDPALLLEQREKEVVGGHLGVAARPGQALSRGQSLLRLDGEAIGLHKI